MYALDCIDIVVDIIDVKKSTFHVACFCTLKDSRKHPDVTQFSFPLCAQFVVLSLFSFSYHLWSTVLYIYIYIYIGSLCIDFSIYSDQYVGVEHDICCDRSEKRKKKKRDYNYTFIPTSLFRDCSLIRGFYGKNICTIVYVL